MVPTAEVPLLNLQITVLKKRVAVAPQGVANAYFCGIDEADGDLLKTQRQAWDAVHAAGGKMWAASWRDDLLDAMGGLLDLAVLSRQCRGQITAWHELGVRVWLYSNPNVGPEYPETFRRNYGLILLEEGWDGCCPYAYQHGFGKSIWDDFDSEKYRDICFTYPTIDGVIDTIQWEGFREGITDVRYAATLLKLGGTPVLRSRNLHALRERTIEQIISLAT